MTQEAAWSKTAPKNAKLEDFRKYIMMRLEGQLFGVAVEEIEDILLPQRITPIPLAAAEIKGALNLRGRIVTAIDLRVRLGLNVTDEDRSSHRSVVVNYKNELYSLIVDSVSEVLDLSSDDIERNPENLSSQWKDVSVGVCQLENELMVILDIEKVLGVTHQASKTENE